MCPPPAGKLHAFRMCFNGSIFSILYFLIKINFSLIRCVCFISKLADSPGEARTRPNPCIPSKINPVTGTNPSLVRIKKERNTINKIINENKRPTPSRRKGPCMSQSKKI